MGKTKRVTSYLEQILEATPHETTDQHPLTSHLKKHRTKMDKICETQLEKQKKKKLISDVLQ